MLIRLLSALLAGLLAFQKVPTPPVPGPSSDDKPVEWVCLRDRDVRPKGPGKCPRCGTALVVGIPDFSDFATKIRTTPKAICPGARMAMTFEVVNPTTPKRVSDLEVVHERLSPLLVSRDLKFFAHDHQ